MPTTGPEHHLRFFRKGAVTFGPLVHGGIDVHTDRVVQVPADSPIWIEHLSHPDAAQWIERTNRYTSRPRRASAAADDATDRLRPSADRPLAGVSRNSDRNDYVAAVALLRAIYDMVDRVKAWETDRDVDGATAFLARCGELDRAYDELEARLGIATGMRAGLLRRLIARLRC